MLRFVVGHADDADIYFSATRFVVDDYVFAGETNASIQITPNSTMEVEDAGGNECNEIEGPLKLNPTNVDNGVVELKVVLREDAPLRVTDSDDKVVLFVESCKRKTSEVNSILRQKICFEIVNANVITVYFDGTELDADEFQEGDTSYFELDLATMEMNV